MSKKLKKHTAIILTVISLISANTIVSSAGDYITTYPNTYDTPWIGGPIKEIHQGGIVSKICSSKSCTTDAKLCYCRKKTNDSSVYVKNESFFDAKVSVYGYNPGNNRSSNAAANYDDNSSKGVKTRGLTIPKRQERKIYQFIVENVPYGGGSYAHMHFMTSGTYGKWSPDCWSEDSYYPAN